MRLTSFAHYHSIKLTSNEPSSISKQLRLDNCIDVSHYKTRSGLATAAGFTALALIFSRFSLAPLLWAQFPRVLDVSRPDEAALATLFFLLIPLPGVLAPVALWLGIKAWIDLRHRDKSGWIQAGFAVTMGFVGTLILLSEIYQVTKALIRPI